MSDETETMLDDIEVREDQLSDWERGFIDSLRERVDNQRSLTEKQEDVLDRIWNRVTEKG